MDICQRLGSNTIFSRYAELANVRLLAEELEEQGVRSPARNAGTGRAFGNRPFSRGQLYKTLSNPSYIGRINHGGRSHKANFQPIMDQTQWDAVQAILAANTSGERGPAPEEASLLAGKLVDDRGIPMVAVHACKTARNGSGAKVRYRYYVSRDLQHSGDAASTDGWRLPAREIEPLVRARVIALLNDPLEVITRSGAEIPSPDALRTIMEHGKSAAATLHGPRAPAAKLLRSLVAEVRLGKDRVEIILGPQTLASLLGIKLSAPLSLDVPACLKRRGSVMRLIMQSGSPVIPAVDRTLIKTIVQGQSWWQQLQDDTSLTLEGLARREGVTSGYVIRIVRLAFLSPQILASVIDGTLPAHLTATRLTATGAIAARWDRQFA